ncbi:translation initiation factor eIF-2B subunit alpha [Rhypophila decipiens]|uniref:Translation initiation factor eIF2B subunit alpha n=1 Tax=Rhypophila decipiens TaxID=261697 RepID=A0AAN6Y280_9PEZI|nr:translation initiation factor eIF-2B subunit alpha [Rhypophila decipiens]
MLHWRRPFLPPFHASTHFARGVTTVANSPSTTYSMATDDLEKALPIRQAGVSSQQDGPFDIVKTYQSLLSSDPEITMPVAAIESLIELLRATSATTAMETVEVVKKEKARLLDSAPNPLPLLAGADLFEQYLLRSLRGQSAGDSHNNVPILGFDETRQHLLNNKQLFYHRARAARDNIAIRGAEYVNDGKVILTAGGSRIVTKVLLKAAEDPTKHFQVIYVMDGSARSEDSVKTLRKAGIEVETIRPQTVAHVLGNNKKINLVLVGTEVVTQNGGIISRMGTGQLAFLAKNVPGSAKRFLVAAETHKIVRKTPLVYPLVNRVGIRQRDPKKFRFVAAEEREQQQKEAGEVTLVEDDEVDYTDPEFIDGFVTEQGIKMPSNIWEMVDEYL